MPAVSKVLKQSTPPALLKRNHCFPSPLFSFSGTDTPGLQSLGREMLSLWSQLVKLSPTCPKLYCITRLESPDSPTRCHHCSEMVMQAVLKFIHKLFIPPLSPDKLLTTIILLALNSAWIVFLWEQIARAWERNPWTSIILTWLLYCKNLIPVLLWKRPVYLTKHPSFRLPLTDLLRSAYRPGWRNARWHPLGSHERT